MEGGLSFGYWLRRRRKALDLTQVELAQRVGCVVTTIKKLEADARRPSRQLAERLADHLSIPPEERAAFLQAARAELAADRLALDTQPLAPSTRTTAPSQPTTSFPTGTVTFLFTDIEGSTRRWEQHTEAMATAIARHSVLLHQAIEAHGGLVIKSMGDGLLAAFAIAADGLTATLAAQRALAAEPWGDTGLIPVRMVLHTGAAELRDGDYYGPTLNRAARLVAACHGAQILLSQATAELVRDRLPPDVQLRDLGAHQLRDLTRSEHIFQVVAPDLRADFPPLKTEDYRPQHLPAQPTSLIGREQEVAQLCALLRRADARLVTLTGPGGIGKTRLGLQMAWEPSDITTHGFWFVPLAAIRDPDLVVSAIAQTLGVREASGLTLADSLKTHLRDKQLVLLLDNFEQVADAAPLVAELLAAAPRLKVLVTSRMRLNLSGEREFAVPPLALPPLELRSKNQEPDPGGRYTVLDSQFSILASVEELTQYAAVRLFVERAQAVKADFALTTANAPAVAEICYRLDGLPLAIQLAAARVKLLPPRALLARLSRPLRLLTGGPRDLPARQQTIRNTIDWSYQLLSDGEKLLFARLGLFVGGCTLEAAEAVCNPNGDLPIDMLDGVAALMDQSLLQQIEEPDGEPRFAMLETIREYALERLEASGAAAAMRRRHAEYYLALAQRAEPRLHGAEQDLWLDRLQREHNNLRTSLAWSRNTQDTEQLAMRLVAALWWFWMVRGYASEGQQWLASVLAQTKEVTAARGQALLGAGYFARIQGDFALAEMFFGESLAISRKMGDKHGVAAALMNLGSVVGLQNQYQRATTLFEESQILCRELNDTWGTAWLLFNQAVVVESQGDIIRAGELAEESLRLYRKLSDGWGIIRTLIRMGKIAYGQGYFAQAANWYQESLGLASALGDTWAITYALNMLGHTVLAEGNDASAENYYSQSLMRNQQVSDKDGIAFSFLNLGKLARSRADYTRAEEFYTQSLALYREIGNQLRIAEVCCDLGYVVRYQGDVNRAMQLLREGLQLSRKAGELEGIGLCLAGLAGVMGVQQRSEPAARLFGAAEALINKFAVQPEAVARAERDRDVATVRAQLDDATFAAAWAAGRAMPLEQAIALALAGDRVQYTSA